MRRVVGLLLVTLLFGGFGLVGVARAHNFEDSPRVTRHRTPSGTVSSGDRVVVFGRVKAAPHKVCKVDREVTLFRVRPGADKRLATDTTDAEGEYRFVGHPRVDQTVYVRLPRFFESSYGHSHECDRARSRNLFIDVS